MENYRRRSRLNGEATFGHDVVRAGDRDRDHRNSALEREIEWPFLEGQQFAVKRAFALDVDGHVDALIDNLFGGVDGFDAGLAIAAVNGDEHAEPHGASENGRAKELLLYQNRSAPRNQRNHNRWVEIGNVVRHEDVSARRVEVVEADRFDAHSGEADSGDGSPVEHAVEQADVAREEGPGKSDQCRKWCGDRPEREHDERAEHCTDCSAPSRRPASSQVRQLAEGSGQVGQRSVTL